MIIEQLAKQDMNELRNSVVGAYTTLRHAICKCEHCVEGLDVNYAVWHPEKEGNYNDVWKIVRLLEHFGYPSYSWDTVLYTFKFFTHDHGGIEIQKDGITFNQAVCNVLVEFYNKWKSIK